MDERERAPSLIPGLKPMYIEPVTVAGPNLHLTKDQLAELHTGLRPHIERLLLENRTFKPTAKYLLSAAPTENVDASTDND